MATLSLSIFLLIFVPLMTQLLTRQLVTIIGITHLVIIALISF
jgi:hypothetical protein